MHYVAAFAVMLSSLLAGAFMGRYLELAWTKLNRD